MKQQHNSRTMPSVFGALLLAITCFALQPVVAQTTIELEDYLYQYTANGSYQELLIPESTQATYLYLKVKGGDGGHSVHHDGGIGVTTEGMFEIGTGSNQIRPAPSYGSSRGEKEITTTAAPRDPIEVLVVAAVAAAP